MKGSIILTFAFVVGMYMGEGQMGNAKPNPTGGVMDEVVEGMPEANNEQDVPKERDGKYTDNSHCLVE